MELQPVHGSTDNPSGDLRSIPLRGQNATDTLPGEIPLQTGLPPWTIVPSAGSSAGYAIPRQWKAAPAGLAAIVESSNDAILSVTLAGVVLSWNGGAERLYGYTAKEILGGRPPALVLPERSQELADLVDRAGRGERVPAFESVCCNWARDLVDVSIEISPVRNHGGEIIGTSFIARTISERIRVERELRRSNEALEQFAFAASHDLQEPLRTVSNFVQLLARRYQGRLDAEADLFIGCAVDAAKRMQGLIENLLASSRESLQRGEVIPTAGEAALAEALINLREAIQESRAVITHDRLPVLAIDPVQLTLLFQNLIGNAIKFRGSTPPRVHISAAPETNSWRVSVRDDGIGIDPQSAGRIFTLFERLHPNGASQGTGIGLATCKRMVERAGGRIWADSTAGSGATLHFTIPVPVQTLRSRSTSGFSFGQGS